MITQSEQYFRDQVASRLDPGEEIEATGYFRTFIKERHSKSLGQGARLFADAAQANGYFLALTGKKLVIVKTRAPATSRPLLENTGVTDIQVDDLRVELDASVLLIESNGSTLHLQNTLENKHFPQQSALVDQLSTKFGNGISVQELASQQRQKKLVKVAVVLLAIVAGIAWAALKG